MDLKSVAVNSGMSYADMAKQTVSREPKPVQAQETVTDPTRKAAVPVADEAKNVEKENSRNEGNVSRKMKNALDKVNDKMRPTKTKCEFSYHEETKRVSIKVIDEDTKEVIREIPPEETLEMLSKMWELAGILVDEKR